MQFQLTLGGRHGRCIPVPIGLMALLATLSIIASSLQPTDSITITTVYAGKKKFKSFNLGIPFLPTLVKVKPNRLSLSFRNSRYIRPPKFKIEGSIPLKVPTIIVKQPDPYEYAKEQENMQVININKDIRLGQDNDKGSKDYYAAGTDQQEVQVPSQSDPPQSAQAEYQQGTEMEPMPMDGAMPLSMPPPPLFHGPPFETMQNAFPFMPPLMPLMSPETAPMSLVPFPSSDQQGQVLAQLPPDLHMKARSLSRTKRSLNLNEPYHHHVNKMPNSPPPQPLSPPRMERFLRPRPNPMNSYGFPQMNPVPTHGPFPPPPSALYALYPPMYPFPYQFGPMAKQDTPSEAQQFVLSDTNGPAQSLPPSANHESQSNDLLKQQQDQRSLIPMKINIGEHYNPNMVYMDESIVPNLEDTSMIDASNTNSIEEPMGMESSYQQQYYKGANKHKDTGPDDFRISFSLSGVHGGQMVPLGTGDNIEQFYKQLKKFEGNNLPVGLPPDQLYKYYRAHTFTNGIKVYRMTPAKVIKAKLFKGLFG